MTIASRAPVERSIPVEDPTPPPDVRRESELRAAVLEMLSRKPVVGFALAVVRDGKLEFFHGHGLADIASRTPVTRDTVFRIGSVTKLFTAIAVMQLWEQGLVDLDAPATDYLRTYRLVRAKPSFRQPTLRDLLTHTAGIPDARHITDLLHFDWGPSGARPPVHSVRFGESLPSLAEYYRAGLGIVVEPGSAFAYSNPGFATLGQIVEDVTGEPLDRYLRKQIFEPLGMTDTDLLRSDRLARRLATGYVLARDGARPVPDRDWIGAAGGGVYSTAQDIGRFAAALMAGGANEHGSVLRPATLATMFEPHYQPDPRIPGIGLAFFRSEQGGHRLVGHDGLLPGFNAELLVAPDDGVALVALTNGASGAFFWLGTELRRLLGLVLGGSEERARSHRPQRPEVWDELCGRYQLPPRISDLRGRIAMTGGAEVFVAGGRLRARVLTPIPALYRGFPLEPDDENDPFVFRLDLSRLGMAPARAVFGRDGATGARAVHLHLGGHPVSFVERPAAIGRDRSRWAVLGLLAGGVVIGTLGAQHRRRRRTA